MIHNHEASLLSPPAGRTGTETCGVVMPNEAAMPGDTGWSPKANGTVELVLDDGPGAFWAPRTLVAEPRLILLDEPFGALDQQTRLLMGDEVLRLWRETGATVFLITHALDEAAMLADRIAVMSARPGTLIDVVETNWPHERDSRIVEREHFGAVTSRLWKTLRDESMKTMGRTARSP